MSFYMIIKIIIGLVMAIGLLYWCILYSNIGKASITLDKTGKKIFKKQSLQKAKMTYFVVLGVVIAITCIIDFLAK